jgi:hypothetical protein
VGFPLLQDAHVPTGQSLQLVQKGEPVPVSTISPPVKWLHDKLEDGEWHDVTELTEAVMKEFRLEWAVARNIVGRQSKVNRFEVEWAHGKSGKKKKRFVSRLRLRPGGEKFKTSGTCKRCGRPDLFIEDRVRVSTKHEVVLDGVRRKQVAPITSYFICLPCFYKEMEKRQVDPFPPLDKKEPRSGDQGSFPVRKG